MKKLLTPTLALHLKVWWLYEQIFKCVCLHIVSKAFLTNYAIGGRAIQKNHIFKTMLLGIVFLLLLYTPNYNLVVIFKVPRL